MHSCKIIWLGIFWLEIVCEAAGRVARSGVAEVKGQPDSRAVRASNFKRRLSEGSRKFYNHKEGPYQDRLIDESSY